MFKLKTVTPGTIDTSFINTKTETLRTNNNQWRKRTIQERNPDNRSKNMKAYPDEEIGL